MRACGQCGSVSLYINVRGSLHCTTCGYVGSSKDFPHLHDQGTDFQGDTTTGKGSRLVKPERYEE